MMVKDKKCFFCDATEGLDEHHCMHGTANRKLAEKYDLKVWLCRYHHTIGIRSVHKCKQTDTILQKYAQKYFEENIGSHELWMQEFKKNYL